MCVRVGANRLQANQSVQLEWAPCFVGLFKWAMELLLTSSFFKVKSTVPVSTGKPGMKGRKVY